MLLLDLLFPRRCPLCDEPIKPGKELVCPPCYSRISYLAEPTCLKCGKKIKGTAEFCDDCTSRTHHFDRGIALYEYQSISTAIYRFKYKNTECFFIVSVQMSTPPPLRSFHLIHCIITFIHICFQCFTFPGFPYAYPITGINTISHLKFLINNFNFIIINT